MRLLAFNYAGSLVQLIERDEIFRLVLQRACVAATRSRFQADWAEASQISATKTVAAWMSERRRKAALINELVEHHTRYDHGAGIRVLGVPTEAA